MRTQDSDFRMVILIFDTGMIDSSFYGGDVFESIVKGKNVGEPGVPESFKVLIKELQALSLDVKMLINGQEIDSYNVTGAHVDTDNDIQNLRKRKFQQGQLILDNDIDLFSSTNPFDDNLDDDNEDDKDAAFASLFGGAAEINIVDPFEDKILTAQDLLDGDDDLGFSISDLDEDEGL